MTAGGAVVVAAATIASAVAFNPECADDETVGAITLARFTLQHAPPELLARLEVAPAELVGAPRRSAVMMRQVDVDTIETEVSRARIVLQMADARMNDLAGTGDGGGKDDVFLVTQAIVLGHLDAIIRLIEGEPDQPPASGRPAEEAAA